MGVAEWHLVQFVTNALFTSHGKPSELIVEVVGGVPDATPADGVGLGAAVPPVTGAVTCGIVLTAGADVTTLVAAGGVEAPAPAAAATPAWRGTVGLDAAAGDPDGAPEQPCINSHMPAALSVS